MEGLYYDDFSIAAASKRERLMTEVEEYRFRNQIAAIPKAAREVRAASSENMHRPGFLPKINPNPAPAH
jgi:hypothetical protein